MLTWAIQGWRDHGTKVLGSLMTVVSAIQASDQWVQQVLTAKQHAWLAIGTTVLSCMIVRRGFTNGRRRDDDGSTGPSP